QTQLKMLPQGTTPPLIIAYSAPSVPVLQLALSGKGMSEQELQRLRSKLYPHAVDHHTRCCCALSLRWQAAPGSGRSQPFSTASDSCFLAGCGQCACGAEPYPSNWNVENWRYRI